MAQEHVISTKANVGVMLLLVALALATLGVSYVDLRRWNLVVAMAIAVAKMMLVILVFMHGWFMPRVSKFAFFSGIFWLGILVVLTMSDYLSRGWLMFGGR
jgi:cytochrome c oxidase subunit 4